MIKKGDKVVDVSSIKQNSKVEFISAVKEKKYETGVVNKVSNGYAYVKFSSKGSQFIPILVRELKQLPNGDYIDDAYDLYEMKLAEKLLSLFEVLKKSELAILVSEIESSYDKKEMSKFKSFDDLIDSEDVRNAYEEEWEDEKEYWIPYYKEVWKMYKNNQLKLED